MKKVLLIGASAFAVSAYAQTDVKLTTPTLYGKIHKHMGYIDQDDKGRKSFSGVRDVDNSETRLGVKGKMDISEVNASYALEVGLNSSNTSDSSKGRIRMRLAEIIFNSKFGKVTVGQTLTPMAKKSRSLDPLIYTVLGLVHTDQTDMIAGARKVGKGGLGSIDRSRVDLIAYTTPAFAGITYTVSTDKNNKMSNDSTDADYGSTSYEHVLDFNHSWDELKLNVFAGYLTTADAGQKSDTALLYGTKIGFKAFEFGFGMTNSEVESGGSKQEIDQMIGSLAYSFGKNEIAFTYQTAQDDNKIAASDDEITQLALGYKYAVTSNLNLHTTVGTYEYKDKKTAANNNDATLAFFGAELKF